MRFRERRFSSNLGRVRGLGPVRDRDEVSPATVPGILVVYHRPDYRLTPRPFADAATVREHIHSFARNSRFPVWEVNTDLGFPARLREVHPTVLVLHYSLFGPGATCSARRCTRS